MEKGFTNADFVVAAAARRKRGGAETAVDYKTLAFLQDIGSQLGNIGTHREDFALFVSNKAG